MGANEMKRFIPSLFVFVFILVTNRYFSVQKDQAFITATAGDVFSYQAITDAAPQLPSEAQIYHHAQRFALPFFVGVIGNGFGIPNEWVMRFVVCLMLLAGILLTDGFATKLGYSPGARLALVALIFLNPYVARISLAMPFMGNDLGFILGLILTFTGLFLQSPIRMVAGSLLAILCRQTAILFAFPMTFYFVLATWYGLKSYRERMAAIACSAIVVAGYFLTGFVASHFSGPSINLSTLTGLFDWWSNHFDLHLLLLEFVAKGIGTFLVSLTGFGLILFYLGKPHREIRDIRVTLGAVSFLLTSVLIAMQPILGGPEFGNLPRLSVLGLWSLLFGMALLHRGETIPVQTPRIPPRVLITLLMVLALNSLHHLFSWPGHLIFQSEGQWFFLLQLILGGFLLFGILMAKFHRNGRFSKNDKTQISSKKPLTEAL